MCSGLPSFPSSSHTIIFFFMDSRQVYIEDFTRGGVLFRHEQNTSYRDDGAGGISRIPLPGSANVNPWEFSALRALREMTRDVPLVTGLLTIILLLSYSYSRVKA